MNTVSKTTKNLFIAALISLVASVSQAKPESQNNAEEAKSLSEIQKEVRLHHAHELLGKYYSRSAAFSGEHIKKINSRIYKWTRQRLAKKYRKDYQRLAQAIIDESTLRGFDPVFLLSVIQGESSFDPRRKGKLDEIGLMQLRPDTAKWIAKKYDINYTNSQDLYDPVMNVKLGAAYLDFLRERFDSHAQLYLAAYNMGQRNVEGALDRNVWPKDYPQHIMKQYRDFYAELATPQTVASRN